MLYSQNKFYLSIITGFHLVITQQHWKYTMIIPVLPFMRVGIRQYLHRRLRRVNQQHALWLPTFMVAVVTMSGVMLMLVG